MRRSILGLLSILSLSPPCNAQEAWKSSVANLASSSTNSNTESTPQWSVEWQQVASGIEREGPLQLQPLLGIAYRWSTPLWTALRYDFQTFAFELSFLNSQSATRSWGWALGLLPEMRSYSWKAGPWACHNVGQGRSCATLQFASVNTLGHALWANDLKSAPSDRAWLVPVQIQYIHPLIENTHLNFGFEAQWSLGKNIIKNRYSALLGLARIFP